MSHSLLQTEGGFAVQTVTLNKAAAIDPLPFDLSEHLARLRGILPAIDDAVAALRRQNADSDADIAYDLTEQASEPLDYEIDRIESLLALRPKRRRKEEARA